MARRFPTETFSLAHRPDLELLLRIRAKPSRWNGEGGGGGETTGNLDWDVME